MLTCFHPAKCICMLWKTLYDYFSLALVNVKAFQKTRTVLFRLFLWNEMNCVVVFLRKIKMENHCTINKILKTMDMFYVYVYNGNTEKNMKVIMMLCKSFDLFFRLGFWQATSGKIGASYLDLCRWVTWNIIFWIFYSI